MNSKIVSIPKIVPVSVINEAIQFYLKEGREDDFKIDVKDHLKPEAIEYIIKNDPSSSKKYLKWIGTQVKASKGLDINGLMNNIKLFDKKIKGVDINSLKSVDELDNKLNTRVVSNKEALRNDTDIIADTDEWLVVAPKTHESSMNYGGSTKWCISTSNDIYWHDYYTDRNNIIVIIKDRNKTPDDDTWKVALIGQCALDIVGWTVSDNDMSFDDTKKYLRTLPKNIYNNIIKYLSPKIKIGSITVFDKGLTSLVGSPIEVGKNFNVGRNNLSSLDGAPKKVGGNFNVARNILKSLKGCPDEIGRDFVCFKNELTSLLYSPSLIHGDLYCNHNNLETLEGAPSVIKGTFDCSHNPIINLNGCPKKVGENFVCMGSKVKFTEEQVRAVCDVGGDVIL